MNNKEIKLIVISFLIMVCSLVATVFTSISNVNSKTEEYCFEQLSNCSKLLATDLYNATKSDKNMLESMANIMVRRNDYSPARLLPIINSYDLENSYLDYVAILTSDNKYMSQDGTTVTTQDLDFATESQKGSYISQKCNDVINDDKEVIRNVVPVKKDDQVIGILYGVIFLDHLSERYITEIYNGKAYVYLEDGDSGDFLIDTWHKSLGNISDFQKRETIPGYSFPDTIKELSKGKSGDIVFLSKTINEHLYLHYEPTKINNWNVLVSIDEINGFAAQSETNKELYTMAFIVAIILIIYMIFIIYLIIKIYRNIHRKDLEDYTTKLQNRLAYDNHLNSNTNTTYDIVTCIYIDVNGLHEINNVYGHKKGDEMLRDIALIIKEQFENKEVYRIGGDEFVVITTASDIDSINERVKMINNKTIEMNYSISIGTITLKNVIGLEQLVYLADEQMLNNKRDYYKTHDRRKART